MDDLTKALSIQLQAPREVVEAAQVGETITCSVVEYIDFKKLDDGSIVVDAFRTRGEDWRVVA